MGVHSVSRRNASPPGLDGAEPALGHAFKDKLSSTGKKPADQTSRDRNRFGDFVYRNRLPLPQGTIRLWDQPDFVRTAQHMVQNAPPAALERHLAGLSLHGPEREAEIRSALGQPLERASSWRILGFQHSGLEAKSIYDWALQSNPQHQQKIIQILINNNVPITFSGRTGAEYSSYLNGLHSPAANSLLAHLNAQASYL